MNWEVVKEVNVVLVETEVGRYVYNRYKRKDRLLPLEISRIYTICSGQGNYKISILIFVENIPLCSKYYNKICVYSTVQRKFLFLFSFWQPVSV